MIVGVVAHNDRQALKNIQNTLMDKWISAKTDVQKYWVRFEEALRRNCTEFAYAYLSDEKGNIVLIASLHAQYKLTRGLCTCYHLEVVYKTCLKEEQLYFQQQVVKMLPAYKITGLNVSEGPTFKPHQIFMDLCLQTPKQKSSL